MGKFLNAAYIVFKKEQAPLSAKELTDKAIEQGFLATKGKTPHQTMKSKISIDILKNKERSLFKRTASGEFALREWEEREYYAHRFKKALFDEDIVVFDKAVLKTFVCGNGLAKFEHAEVIIDLINRNCYSIRRRIAEQMDEVIQLISAFIVRYDDRYLTFKRTKRLPEKRLHGFYSILFGGHVAPGDIKLLFNMFDPIRELSEELKLDHNPRIKFRGLLYDDAMPVSSIHLGVVYDVFLDNMNYEIGEKGFLMDPKFEDIDSMWRRINDFENWSQIIIKGEMSEN